MNKYKDPQSNSNQLCHNHYLHKMSLNLYLFYKLFGYQDFHISVTPTQLEISEYTLKLI